jgi:hypothetical protein
MAIPPIEMRWGGGANWSRAQRRRITPFAATALALVDDGLEYFGIEPTVPKRATIWRVGSNFELGGSSEGPEDFELYITNNIAKRSKKIARLATPLAISSFHEVLHCVRDETDREPTLLERAATEGISVCGERELAKSLLLTEEYKMYSFQFRTSLDERLTSRLIALLCEDYAEEAVLMSDGIETDEVHELHDMWFDGDGQVLPLGYQIGVVSVSRLLEEGASFPEIISMSAEQILGLAV